MIRLSLGLMVVLSAAAPKAFAGVGTCMSDCAVKRSAGDTGCRFKSSDKMGKCIEDNRKAYAECKEACAKQYNINESSPPASGTTPPRSSTEPEPSPSTGPLEGQPNEPRR